jgi:hypothetical protein
LTKSHVYFFSCCSRQQEDINLTMGGIDSRCIKQLGDAGGCWIYLPNEKIVGLEGKELSILFSVFLPVFTRFWS